MNGLDLFSGIGGLTLALRDYINPFAYCEIDKYCQAVLLSRMHTGELPKAPIWDDIKTIMGSILPSIDIIYGGFPCQDISFAGNGKGLEGKRSGLFFEIMRVAKEIKPKFLFLENVPAITTRGGLRVVREITEMGYDCRWCIISAQSIGALHKRERWFLLAYSKHYGSSTCENWGSIGEVTEKRPEQQQTQMFGEVERTSCISGDVANLCDSNIEPSQQTNSESKSNTTEQDTRRRSPRLYWPLESREHWKETVSSMGKCTDGISYHVDRLRALGNAVVPEQAKEAFEILMGIKYA